MSITLEARTSKIMSDALARVELAKLECSIIESLPAQPASVHVYTLYKSVASATYNAVSRQEALALYQQFVVSPSYICRSNNSVSVKCFDDEAAKEVQEVHATVSIDQYSQELEFFTATPSGMVHIEIRLPLGTFGTYTKSDRNARINYKMNWVPKGTTKTMFLAISYAPADYRGPSSGRQKVYALYDAAEVINQFSEVN